MKKRLLNLNVYAGTLLEEEKNVYLLNNESNGKRFYGEFTECIFSSILYDFTKC